MKKKAAQEKEAGTETNINRVSEVFWCLFDDTNHEWKRGRARDVPTTLRSNQDITASEINLFHHFATASYNRIKEDFQWQWALAFRETDLRYNGLWWSVREEWLTHDRELRSKIVSGIIRTKYSIKQESRWDLQWDYYTTKHTFFFYLLSYHFIFLSCRFYLNSLFTVVSILYPLCHFSCLSWGNLMQKRSRFVLS